MADIHGSPGDAPQLPASDSGPAPVPYTGQDLSPEPPAYAATGVSFHLPGSGDVLPGVSGNLVQESAYAHDVNAGLVTTYYPGAISPIVVHGDPDAGGRDIVSDSVAGAVAAREAYYMENSGDAMQAGPSHVGDFMTFPATTATGAPLDSGTVAGITDPAGGFYDPPRSY